MKAHYISYCILALALISSCSGSGERTSAIQVEDTIPVKLMPLQQLGALSAVEATGIFTTDDETLLGFKNGGVISKIYVKEGDAIRKGQRLASVQAVEVDAMAGQANIALEKARRDYERARKLYLDSVATLEQMQNAKSALELAEQDVHAVTYNQQHLHIVSPVTGYVLAKLANEGQVVGPGTPVLQVNGAAKGKWTLKVGVGDAQWAVIQKGDEAMVYTDALPDREIKAIVSKKSEGLDPQSGTFTVYLELQGQTDGKLASGIFGKSKIITKGKGEEQHSWQIPYESLVDAHGKEAYVFVTKDGKTAVRQKVILGDIHNDAVTVVKGLEGIESIIVSGSPYLVDGSVIRIKK